jgi:hypothetical protein
LNLCLDTAVLSYISKIQGKKAKTKISYDLGENETDHLNDNISHFIARAIVYAYVATKGLPQVYCPENSKKLPEFQYVNTLTYV